MKSKQFPWEQLLRISYTQLGLTPAIFWQMTPCEWLLLMQNKCRSSQSPVERQELLEMIALFPD